LISFHFVFQESAATTKVLLTPCRWRAMIVAALTGRALPLADRFSFELVTVRRQRDSKFHSSVLATPATDSLAHDGGHDPKAKLREERTIL
jgi:hypothetical protein